MRRKTILLATIVLFTLTSLVFSDTPSFQGLGDLPGSLFYSAAEAVSSDGLVVVGYSSSNSAQQHGYPTNSYEAFRWENGTMTGLGDLPGGDPVEGFYSTARAVSADGMVVVGVGRSSESDIGHEAFRWENSTMTGLGDLPGGDFESQAWGVSADGSVVVGWSYSASGQEAFRWKDETMTGLGSLPTDVFLSSAYDASADGSVVVGGSRTGLSSYEAFRWEDGTMTGLGDLPGGSFSSGALAVSADGSVVVGMGSSASGREAFRWEDGTMMGLGDLPGGEFYSEATDVSANGSVVVGYSKVTGLSGPGWGHEAFIWEAEKDMVNLKDLLENECGLDLNGWTLTHAFGVSADGLTIVGQGVNPDGYTEAYIATVPEPATLLLFGLGAVMLRKCQ